MPQFKSKIATGSESFAQNRKDMLALIERFNIAEDGSSIIAADYLEVLVDKK